MTTASASRLTTAAGDQLFVDLPDLQHSARRLLELGASLGRLTADLRAAPAELGRQRGVAAAREAIDVDLLLRLMSSDVHAVAALAAAMGAARDELAGVEQSLGRAAPFGLTTPWRRRVEVPVRGAELLGTLWLEGALAACPHELDTALRPALQRIPDGPGWATPTGPPAKVPHSPASPAGWLRAVAGVQQHPGQLAVLRLANGRWVVLLPGIHSLAETSDPQDLPGAAHALAARHGGYGHAVGIALRAAGVPAGAKLMIVGHSQGGIVAADLAADPLFRSHWHITHVLAAGSPIADVPVPPATRLLALDNADDIVPALDLQPHRQLTDRVQVRFADEEGSVGRNHSLAGTYVPFAATEGFAHAPGVAAWEASAAPYLAGAPATTQTFALTDSAPEPTAAPVQRAPVQLRTSD